MGIQTTATCDACKEVIDVSRSQYGEVNYSTSAVLTLRAPGWEPLEQALFCPKCTDQLIEILQLELSVAMRKQSASQSPTMPLPGRIYGAGMAEGVAVRQTWTTADGSARAYAPTPGAFGAPAE